MIISRVIAFAACIALALGLLAATIGAESKPRPPSESGGVVLRDTTNGLILVLRVDHARIFLDKAELSRVPKDPPPVPKSGDTITVTGLLRGRTMAKTVIQDPLYAIIEHGGTVRQDKRQILVTVPTERAIDTVVVQLSLNRAEAKFEVRNAYAGFCRGRPDDPLCRGLK